MDMLLKLLIWSINTIDGRRGSAQGLKQRLMKEAASQDETDEETKTRIDYQVMMKALYGFKMIRMRQKISFKCMRLGKTLSELFLGQILRTYKVMRPEKEEMIDDMIEVVNKNEFDSFENMLKVIVKLRSIQDEVVLNTSFKNPSLDHSLLNHSKNPRHKSSKHLVINMEQDVEK